MASAAREPGEDRQAFHAWHQASDHAASSASRHMRPRVLRRWRVGDGAGGLPQQGTHRGLAKRIVWLSVRTSPAGGRQPPASRSNTRLGARSDSSSSAARTTDKSSLSRTPVTCHIMGTFIKAWSRDAVPIWTRTNRQDLASQFGPRARTGSRSRPARRAHPAVRRLAAGVPLPAHRRAGAAVSRAARGDARRRRRLPGLRPRRGAQRTVAHRRRAPRHRHRDHPGRRRRARPPRRPPYRSAQPVATPGGGRGTGRCWRADPPPSTTAGARLAHAAAPRSSADTGAAGWGLKSQPGGTLGTSKRHCRQRS